MTSSLPPLPKKPLGCLTIPLENGLILDSCPQLELLVDIDSMLSTTSSTLKESSLNHYLHHLQSPKLSTVESLHTSKRMTSNDKESTYQKSSLVTLSSQMLDQGSTSSAKDFKPSSRWLSKEHSKKLWLPIETDSVGLPSNSLSGSFKPMESGSWFSIKKWTPLNPKNSLTTSCPSYTSLTVECKEGESIERKQVKKVTKKKEAIVDLNLEVVNQETLMTQNQKNDVEQKDKVAPKSKKTAPKKKGEQANKKSTAKQTAKKKPTPNSCWKHRIKMPDKNTEQTLLQWFGSVRKTYNWALSCIKKNPKEYKCTNAIWLRKRFVNSNRIPKNMRYLLDTPKSIRDSAIMDLSIAYKSNFTKKAKDPSFQFEMKFRRKKECQSFTIVHTDIKQIIEKEDNTLELKMFPTFLKNYIRLKVRQRDLRLGKGFKDPLYDCKLTLDTQGRIYLCVPRHVPSACENQASAGEQQWVALDPGVRTFLTGYSPKEGDCFQVAPGDVTRIYRLCIHIDKLISKMSKVSKGKQGKIKRKRMNKAIARLRERVLHLTDEVHWKTIKYLTSNYTDIVIPDFNSTQMSERVKRKIGCKTVRQMLSWRHGKFRERLIGRSEITKTKVYVRTEEYTSKTCTCCLEIHPKLGGNKIFKCPNCHIKVDRDVGGARNIFLKNCAVSLETALPR